MNLIDSFGWIEYFAEGSLAQKYAQYIEPATRENTVTPTIVVFEVYRRLKVKKGEQRALEAYAQLTETRMVDLDDGIALLAADLSLELGLGMADSIVLATARRFGAQILTSDRHFENIPEAKLIQ